ncbi:MAG: undecaprenyl-diphosphate phosphatase [Opitutae bacterium]|nr:undecaprenyl-diphosphate phosphatase [Opitutae bacterium]
MAQPVAGLAAPSAPVDSTAHPVAELSVRDAIVLGIVEGVTEFLPISSTGHLIIANQLLGLESDKPLTDQAGRPLFYKKPSAKHPDGVPLTLKLAADTYTVVIQFGAIAAVALLYWSQLMSMLRGLLGRDPAGLHLLVALLIAFIPAAVVGLLVHDWIDAHLFSIGAVIVAQVAGAVLMLAVEYWRRRQPAKPADEAAPLQLSPKQAIGIGALQCVAMWPGTSRSMMCIVGGYFAGLNPRRAAEFSFLLGFVTLSAATVFKSYKSGAAMIQVFGWSHVLLGCVVAAMAAAAAVRFFVGFLTRYGLTAFALYRVAIAVILAVGFLR